MELWETPHRPSTANQPFTESPWGYWTERNELNLVEILQQGDFLLHEELSAGVWSIVLRPEGADIHARWLCDIDERRHAPKEGSVDPHQVLRREAVGLVEDEANLGLAALHLAEEHLQLAAHIQLGGVEHQEDEVGSVDEPLAHVVVRVTCELELG